MAKRPTIHDVAREAGVSVTTVSDALNGKGRVDPKTRERVVEVVRRLGYQANRHARGLRSGQAGALGLLLPVTGDARTDEALSLDFYMRLAAAAAASAFAQQQALILLPPKLGPAMGGLILDGGIVVDPSERDPRVTLLEEQGLPVVTIEPDLGRDHTWFVASRTDENTRVMLDHLYAQGARRIAVLLPRASWGWATETRLAYDAWVDEHGMEGVIVLVSMSRGEEHAYQATLRLLNRRDPPDAIFVLAARFVRGVVRAAHALGRQVPDELLLGAGVDSVQAREADPPVTALELHPERQAAEAVEMLLARVRGASVPQQRYVSATPRFRTSTVGALHGP